VATSPKPAPKRSAKQVSDLSSKKSGAKSPVKTKSTAAKVPAKAATEVTPAVTVASTGVNLATDKAAAPKADRDNRKLIWRIALAALAVIVVFLLVFGILIYKYQSDTPVVKAVSAVIPYPVESVNGQFVSYNEYLFQLNTAKSYYAYSAKANGQQLDWTSATGKTQLEQLKKQIMNILTEQAVVSQLAAQHKVTVSSKEVNADLATLVKNAGSEAKLKQALTADYGWTEGNLKTELQKQLLQAKLTQTLENDPTLQAQAKTTAQNVLNQINAGGDFATLAKKYSQDSATASSGGDLGSIANDSSTGLDPAFLSAAFALQSGQVSGLVKTANGYEIIKVNSITGTQRDVSHILIQPLDFQTYIQQQVDKAHVVVYLHV